jgi:hypothetical protein
LTLSTQFFFFIERHLATLIKLIFTWWIIFLLGENPAKQLIVVAGHTVSFQITVLKVLAGHPDGRASVADLTRCVAILISSGSDWADRMKRLADRASELDIFSSKFVLRDDRGWQITDPGRQFLASLEMSIRAALPQAQPQEVLAAGTLNPDPPLLRLVVDNTRTSPQTDGEPDQTRQSA